MWELPIIVPTCPKKLFEQGPRKKYTDIATDALHASSADLTTWNTLAMMRLKLQRFVPDMWQEITAASLDAWDKREQQEPFLTDNRRGYARITPVGTSTGVEGQTLPPADQYPLHGLGFCDQKESSTQFTTYVWSSWTSKTVQPMHGDQSLRDKLNGPARGSVSTCVNQSKSSGQESNKLPAQSTQSKDERVDGGSKKPSREREREPPDTTTKPEGKSLKTSGAASLRRRLPRNKVLIPMTSLKRPVLVGIKGNQLRVELRLIGDMLKPMTTRKKKQGECIASCQHGNLKDCVKLLCAPPPTLWSC